MHCLRLLAFVLAGWLMINGAACEKLQSVVDDAKPAEAIPALAPPVVVTPLPVAPPAVPSPVEPVKPEPKTPEQLIAEFQALPQNEKTDAKLAELAGLSSGLESIEVMELTSSPVSDFGLAHLSKMTSIKSLKLSRTRIAGTGLSVLTDLPTIETLELDQTQVDNIAAEQAGKSATLRELSLRNTSINDGAFASLRDLQALEVLRVDGAPNLTGRQFAELTKQGGFRNLRELTASSTQFGFYGLQNINALKQLEVLRVAQSNLPDDAVQAVSGCVNLKVLDLSANPVTDATVQKLAKLKHLEELSLSGCQGISDASLNFLKATKSLKLLDVNGTSCSEKGIESVKNKFLKETNIRFAGKEF